MSFIERFADLLKNKGLKQGDFCKITGYGQVTLSNIMTGKTAKPRIDLLETIGKYFPEVNIHWLITGRGNMYLSDAELLQLTQQYTDEEDKESNDLLQKLIDLQDSRIKELEREIKKSSPKLADELGLE